MGKGDYFNPCNLSYWEKNIGGYLTVLLDPNFIVKYESSSEKFQGRIIGIHIHITACNRCKESITSILSDLSSDTIEADELNLDPIPSESFAHFKSNSKYLDQLV